MENVYAALLLHKASKEINESNLEKVLNAAGISPDKNQIKMIVAGLSGKNIDELIASASVAAVPTSAPSSGASAAVASTDDKKDKKKKEKKEEKKEEEITGIGSLFG